MSSTGGISLSSSSDLFKNLDSYDEEAFTGWVLSAQNIEDSTDDSSMDFEDLASPLNKLKNRITQIKKEATTEDSLLDLSIKIGCLIEKLNIQKKNCLSDSHSKTISEIIDYLSDESADIDHRFKLLNTANTSPIIEFLNSLSELTVKTCNTVSSRFQHYSANNYIDFTKTAENYHDTIRKLIEEPGSHLNSSIFFNFITLLEEAPGPKEYEILATAITNSHTIEHRAPSIQINQSLEKRELLKKKLILIPFVYKGYEIMGWSRGHIVLIVVDKEKKSVEYYDPHGHPPETRKNYDGFCMKKDLEEVKHYLFGDDSSSHISVLTNKIQKDIHNCGVHVMDIMIKRIKGASFEDIEKEDASTTDIQETRINLARLFETGVS